MRYQLSIELHDAVTPVGTDDEVGCIVLTVRASARVHPDWRESV
jgi:hypothetical protein